MPLPLPNLDTRRWADLVEEGRSLIPRYAPGWTDHNVHDPGITLVELFAWVTDLAIYRTNIIPVHHRRKFLALIGFPPQPPQPAHTAFTFRLSDAAEPLLPAGTTIAPPRPTDLPGGLRFQTIAPLTILPCHLQAVQSFDGFRFTDHTRANTEGTPYAPWGTHPPTPDTLRPEQQAALYLGFEQALPPGKPLSLWLQFIGRGTDHQERDRILTALHQTHPSLLRHHTAQAIWEYYDGNRWQALDPDRGEVVDATRCFSLSGPVQVTVSGSMGAIAVGLSSAFYLRCRLVQGLPDAAPLLAGVGINAVAAQQLSSVRSTFAFAGNATVSGVPIVGQRNKLNLDLDSQGLIRSLTVDPEGEALEVWVLDYQKDSNEAPIHLTLTLVNLDRGSGYPQHTIQLDSATAITHNQIQLWTLGEGQLQRWEQQPDLDASRRTDAHFQWEPTTQTIRFGDGERGRVVPEDAWILAAYDTTAGAAGNVLRSLPWQILGADDAVNQALFGQSQLQELGQKLAIAPCAPFTGGADQETLDHAAGRAVEVLWAHERLIDLCPPTHSPTLDQMDLARVLSSQAPERATTLLDFERLALHVPGTRVARARAWAGLDPAYPCVQAPGTVTVVVVPELPQRCPSPSPGLLDAVQRYLDRRRSIATRLVVVAPDYLEVQVQAIVHAQSNADPDRISADVLVALNRFLDPLLGGDQGFGYPFGRDVYRTEILQVIDEVVGVDHVVELRLQGRSLGANGAASGPSNAVSGWKGGDTPPTSPEAAQCGNLCVAPTQLVAPGQHTIQVLRGGIS